MMPGSSPAESGVLVSVIEVIIVGGIAGVALAVLGTLLLIELAKAGAPTVEQTEPSPPRELTHALETDDE